MKCLNCNKEIIDIAKFCPHCGAQQIFNADKTDVSTNPEITERTPSVENNIPQSEIETVPILNNNSEYNQTEFIFKSNEKTKKKGLIYKKWWFWLIIALIVIGATVGTLFATGVFNDFFEDYDSSYSDFDDSEDEDSDEEDSENDIDDEYDDESDDDEDSEEDDSDEDDNEEDDSESDDDDSTVYYNEDKYNHNNNHDDESHETESINFDEKIVIDDLVKFEFSSAEWCDEIVPSNDTYDGAFNVQTDKGNKFLVIEGEIKNLSDDTLPMYNFNIKTIFDDDEIYTSTNGCMVYVENNEGDNLSLFEEIEPNEKRKIYLVCEVPEDVYEDAETCEYYFGFDDELSFGGSVGDVKDCRYSYVIKMESIDDRSAL